MRSVQKQLKFKCIIDEYSWQLGNLRKIYIADLYFLSIININR